MRKTYTRRRTIVKPLHDEGQVIVTINACHKIKRSVAFEWLGRRYEIIGREENERAEERGAA